MDGTLTHPVRIVHLSPGRIRVRIQPEDLGNPALGRIQHALTTTPGVRSVQVNALARSLVVTYDPRIVDFDDLVVVALRTGISFSSEPEQNDGTAGIRPVDETVVSFFRNADDRVRERLGGTADLRTLLPAGLALLALREIAAGRLVGMPWYVLIWYSVETFHKFRRPESASPPTQQ
jgi:hypothetical protein